MPKLKPSPEEDRNRIVRAIIVYNRYPCAFPIPEIYPCAGSEYCPWEEYHSERSEGFYLDVRMLVRLQHRE